MRLAVQTPPEHTSFAALRDVWQAADDLGYEAAFTFDHLVPLRAGERPGWPGGDERRRGLQYDGWLAATALAAGTRRIQVGTLVTGVTYRHPAVLAKMAVTLDHVTDGRAILGIGAGWHEEEHRMFGLPFPGAGERMRRLDETLDMFRLLCTTDGPVTYDGRSYRLDEAIFEPKPIRPSGIPVLVGGSGTRLKRIAACHADLFNGFAAPWEWPAVNAELDAAVRGAGRPEGALRRVAYVFAELSGDRDREDALVDLFRRSRGGSDDEVRRRLLLGRPAHDAAVLRSFADAGVDLVVVNLRPPYSTVGLAPLAELVATAAV